MNRNCKFQNVLNIPSRNSRPRDRGITHVLDKGLGLRAARDFVEMAGAYADIIKLGWGTPYVTPRLQEKVALYRQAGLHVSPGGTALELALRQGKLTEFESWAREQGFDCLEVSAGVLDMTPGDKQRLIARLSRHWLVLSEVGVKDSRVVLAPEIWVRDALADLSAGAWKVLLEGRESGTAGIYAPDGVVREQVAEVLVERVPTDRLILEAPRKEQQVWWIHRLGRSVNLGNIPPEEVIPLETLRLGLRADTFGLEEWGMAGHPQRQHGVSDRLPPEPRDHSGEWRWG